MSFLTLSHKILKITTKEFIIAYNIKWNVPNKMVHTTETTDLSRSWEKMPTPFRVTVSKLYVTFRSTTSQPKARWPLCPGSKITRYWTHTHTHTHARAQKHTKTNTQTQTHWVSLHRNSDQLVAEVTTYTTHNKLNVFALIGFANPLSEERNCCRCAAQNAKPAGST